MVAGAILSLTFQGCGLHQSCALPSSPALPSVPTAAAAPATRSPGCPGHPRGKSPHTAWGWVGVGGRQGSQAHGS